MQTRTFLAAALLLACPLTAFAQVTAPASVVPSAQAVTLRLKFTPGQTLYYSLTTDTVGTILTGQSGAGIPMNNHLVMLLHQTVKDVRATDGAATMESGIDSLTMTMNGQTMPIPEEQVVKMKFFGTMLILPTGKVLSFTPNASLGASLPGMDLSKSNAFGSMGHLPDAPVKPGDTWKSAIAMGMVGAQIASNFSLSSLDTAGGKNVAVIHQTTDGTFDTPNAAKSAASSAMGVKMMGKVNGTGVLRFDVDAGSMDSATSQMDMTMTMVMKGGPAGMKMQMKVNTDMKRTEAPTPTPAAAAPTAQ